MHSFHLNDFGVGDWIFYCSINVSWIFKFMIVAKLLIWFPTMIHNCQYCFQQSNDTCLAYTLAAIGNLLSEIGFSRTSGILGSSYSPLMSMGISLSVQQQLFVLLTESLRRAESLKLKRLVASNHLAMAKFHLMVKMATTPHFVVSFRQGMFILYTWCILFFFFFQYYFSFPE